MKVSMISDELRHFFSAVIATKVRERERKKETGKFRKQCKRERK